MFFILRYIHRSMSILLHGITWMRQSKDQVFKKCKYTIGAHKNLENTEMFVNDLNFFTKQPI